MGPYGYSRFNYSWYEAGGDGQNREVIAAVLKSNGDQEVLEKAKEATKAICNEFPLFQKQFVTV